MTKSQAYTRRYYKKNRKRIIAYNKQWLKEHPDIQAQYQRDYRKRHPIRVRRGYLKSAKQRRAFVWKLKDKPCMDCGIKYHPAAMDFDHRPNTKKDIKFGFTCVGKPTVLREIKKCDLVCSNCHRVRTWKRCYELG